MSDPNTYYKRDPRFTLSSGLLLLIFVGAVAFVLIVAYKMAPWDGDDETASDATAAQTEAPAATSPAAAEEVVDTAPEGAQ